MIFNQKHPWGAAAPRLGRHRRRRIRPAEENVGPGQEMNTPVSDYDLGQEISKAVALFLAGKESSDGASISD